MSYCSLEQLTDRYGAAMLVDLTDRAEAPTVAIDEAVVARAIADATALIDGYLAGRYALPLPAMPALLTDVALPIVLYKLHRQVAADKVRRDYEDALRTLRDLAAGIVRLAIAGAEAPSSGASGVRTNDRPRDMTPDSLRGFV